MKWILLLDKLALPLAFLFAASSLALGLLLNSLVLMIVPLPLFIGILNLIIFLVEKLKEKAPRK